MSEKLAPAAPVVQRHRFAGLAQSAGGFLVLLIAAALVAAVVGTAVTLPPRVDGLTPGPIVVYGIPLMRTILDVAAAVVVGLALIPKLVGFNRPETTEPIMAPYRQVARWASLVWAASALVSIVLLAAELTPGRMVRLSDIWHYLIAVSPGKGLALSAAAALLSWYLAKLSIKHGERVPAELRVGVALFGLLPLPLTGHGSNWYYHDLSMVSMELHVTASTAWAGGLGALIVMLATHRELLQGAIAKFSRLATWCVFIVAASGAVNGLIELWLSPITTLPSSLWETRYGVLLIAKAACIVVIGLIALHVRTRIMPAIEAGRRTALVRWAGLEVLVLALAFGIAVALTKVSVTPF